MIRVLLLAVLAALTLPSVAAQDGVPAQASVCFTPGEDCESLIVAQIKAAKTSLRVEAYYLTSTSILGALRNAVRRGVTVEAILDRVNARKKTAAATYLALSGASVWIDRSVSIAHNKLIIVDDDEVIGGSFNYTKSAQQRNAENVTILSGRAITAPFIKNFEVRRAASSRFAF